MEEGGFCVRIYLFLKKVCIEDHSKRLKSIKSSASHCDVESFLFGLFSRQEIR